MRPPVLPAPDRKFWRAIFRASLISILFWAGLAWALSSCSPRIFQEVNKLAPKPPYAGQYHGGLDRARYLRVEEPVDAD